MALIDALQRRQEPIWVSEDVEEPVTDLRFHDDGPTMYQDVLIDGEVVRKGERECAARYELLRPVLDQYQRPFTVLDVGAGFGYFGLRIVRDYPEATVVMLDFDHRLRKVVELNQPPRTIVLEKLMTVNDFWKMSECEHFDVTLLLSVLHHFEEWRSVLVGCLRMSDLTIVETPDSNDRGACGQHLITDIDLCMQRLERICLGNTPSHTSQIHRNMYEITTPYETGIRRPWLNPTLGCYPVPLPIHSTFTEKTITKASVPHTWIPGINLWTYHVMGGAYPTRSNIVDTLRSFPIPAEHHGDIRPWNFILGDGLHLIDGHDLNATFDDVEGLQETIKIMEEDYALD
jgi:hypothetical protein